jgi:hypothetical protein
MASGENEDRSPVIYMSRVGDPTDWDWVADPVHVIELDREDSYDSVLGIT